MDESDAATSQMRDEAVATPANETLDTQHAPASPATSPEARSRRTKRGDSKPPSAKSSTLRPSTPPQMTTRAASRALTASAANSVASIGSRRSSLAGTASSNASNHEDRPAEDGGHTAGQEALQNGIDTKDHDMNDASEDEQSVRSSQLSNGSPRKRKRELPEVVDSIEAKPTDGQVDENNGQAADLAADEEHTPKRVARGRRRGQGLLAVQAQPYTPSDVSAVNSPLLPPENGDGNFGAALAQAAEKPARRLPGRRRAPHANVYIEADLRRQLSLKMGYRAIVKQLKPILAELAKRSVDQIDDDPDAYKESEHYQDVEDELGDRLQSQLDRLRHLRLYAREEADILLKADREIVQDTFSNRVRDLKADFEVLAKYRILKALRANALEVDADATEDEDGPIPAFRAPATDERAGYILPLCYDSRSRLFRETDRVWNDYAIQRGIFSKRKALIAADDDLTEDEGDFGGFATYEPAEREAIDAARKEQAFLDAISACVQRQAADELAAEVENRKTKDGLDILAVASEKQRLQTSAKAQTQQVPRTPKPSKPSHSRRGSVEETKIILEDPGTAPSSSRRRNSRALRSRESSPAKYTTPQQTNGAATPRMSTNKISDLLNNDQPQALPTIAESSPTWKPGPSMDHAKVIKTETDAGQPRRLDTVNVSKSFSETTHYGASSGPHYGPRRATEADAHQTVFHVDRRVSDTAGARPQWEAQQPRSPAMIFTGGKPTTFDGSGSVVSPTYTLQSPFRNRTSSLGARPGSFAQETRDTVVPPQMSGRRESQRDAYRPASIETLSATGSRPEDDPYSRRLDLSAPLLGRPYQSYAPPYGTLRQYPQPWQQVPLLPGTLPPRYPPLPAYGNEAPQTGNEQPSAQGPQPAPQQEKDMWRHHSYSRGGKR